MELAVSRRSEREDQAHRMADAQWRVFPAEPGGKRPATEHGFLDGTTDHKAIERWWREDPRYNLAVATGAPGPDVLDVDNHGEKGNGFGAFNRLKQAGLVREPMAIVRTPSGGFHAYYRGSNSRNGHLPGEHLDFRSQGGYVISPPSRIAQREYSVLKKQASSDTFSWDAAKQLLAPEPVKQPQRQPYKPPERDTAKPHDLFHLPGWVASQPEGNRNSGLFWAATRAAEAGDTVTLENLANAARAAGLAPGEVGRTIASAQRTAGRGAEHSGGSVTLGTAQPELQAEAGALTPLTSKAGSPRNVAATGRAQEIPTLSKEGTTDVI